LATLPDSIPFSAIPLQIEHVSDFSNALYIVSGTLPSHSSSVVAFSIIRDEIFYLPAFLEYHRRLGVHHFIFLDDGSTDGTFDYLCLQPDCLLLRSQVKYSQIILAKDLSGRISKRRACYFLKQYIPELYLHDKYVLSLDADEFLVLPPCFPDLPSLVTYLSSRNIHTIAASLIEFYPRYLSDLSRHTTASCFDHLLHVAPLYDHLPLLRPRLFGGFRVVNQSASTRIFTSAHIKSPYTTTPYKIPLYLHNSNWIVGSHNAKRRPYRHILLALFHFKFTHDLYRRTIAAINLKSHSQGSRKYECYSRLFMQYDQSSYELTCSHSREYSSPKPLMDIGLMRF